MSTSAEPTPQTKSEPAGASPPHAHSSPVAETANRSGKATAALVLAILGALLAFVIPMVGLILGILGIVFGRQAKRETDRGMSGRGAAQAGFVIGIVAVVIAIAMMVVNAAILAS